MRRYFLNLSIPILMMITVPGTAAWTQPLQEFEGVVICISEEMAQLRGTAPRCQKFGHLPGLKLEDGKIYSFFLNPRGREIRDNPSLLGHRIRVKGRIFREAKIVQVEWYKDLGPVVTRTKKRED